MSNSKHPEEWPAWATETIRLVAPDPSWPAKALQVQQELEQLLSPFGIGPIGHIGSTAVPGLTAKPVIDLIARIPSFDSIEAVASLLRPFDWHYVPPELDARPERRFFIKVANNTRAVHLHFLLPGSPAWERETRFRDLLIHDQSLREQYAALKHASAQQFGNDREAYTESKSEFIARALVAAAIPADTSALPANSPAIQPQRIRIIFATNNTHKVEEIQSAIGDSLEVISLHQAGIDIDIPEPHDTVEANASEKSGTIHRLTGGNCFSEDTGLEVTALHGEPGVKSARYAGEDRAFEKNIQKVLERLDGNPDRSARFRTVISLVWEGREHLFEGICPGHILHQPTGSNGFGYDPIFVPEGDTRSFAQLTMEEKNRYSHRRKAADQLVQFLRQIG